MSNNPEDPQLPDMSGQPDADASGDSGATESSRTPISESAGPLPKPLRWFRQIWLWVGWIAIVGLAGRFVLQLLDPLPAVAFVLTVGAFCIPGWALVSLMWGSDRSTRDAELWLWGGAIGVAISSWVVLIEGAVTGHASGRWVIGLDAVAIVVWMLFARRDGFAPISIRAWTFGERVVSQLAILWVLGIVRKAYFSFGVTGDHGYVLLPASYAVDFLQTLTHVAALSLSIPPESLGLSGVAAPVGSCVLLLPVIGRYWMDPVGSLSAWTMLTHLISALGFIGVVMTVFRAFIFDLRRLIAAVVVLLFAYSSYWLVLAIQSDAISHQSAWWRASLTPLYYFWSLTDAQTLVTLALWMVGALWLRARRQPPAMIGYLGVGIGAGISASIDPQLGWLSLVAAVAWLIVLSIQFPNERERIGLGAFVVIVAVLITTIPLWWFGVQSPYPLSELQFGGSIDDYLSLPARLIILFGPLILLPIWGYSRRGWISHQVGKPMYWVIGAATLFVMLHVELIGDPSYGVRTGISVLFVLLLFALARGLSGDSGWTDRITMIAAAIVLLGVPTAVYDFYAIGPSGPGEAVQVHPEDHQAAMWARENLDADVTVQSWPEYGDSTVVPQSVAPFAWGSHLALRPMAAGPLEGWINELPVSRRVAAEAVFTARRPDSTYFRAKRLGIEYIYAGPHEFRRLSRLRPRLRAAPRYFETVYETDSAGIYRVFPLPLDPDAR
ncbi:MAG: hypothetical protein GF341_05865 [candidate division Zixibacteria bacterium]|nr:hypothetical protein [candidate division Zixibacteria bacterium]